MAHRLSDASSDLNYLIKRSVQINPGPPARHRLLTTRNNLDTSGKIRKWTFGQKHTKMQNKTILMVGQTGTGKTTLINTMVNYYLGVKFVDKVWFEITEEEKKDQTESQTSEITVYDIISEVKPFSLTIIDTPGYGDTRGIDKDIEIPKNLHQLFVHETGVKDLDAVCLVMKSTENRISEVQRYIFEGVLSLFGKDIEDNVVFFMTHSDGGPPTNALKAVRKEKIPCCLDDENEPVYFLFNNRQSENLTKKFQHALKSSWEMGENSMKEFFEFLESRPRKSTNMTVDVLRERIQLEACVQSLREHILFMEAKQRELTHVQKTLNQNKEDIEKDKKEFFKINTVYKEKVFFTPKSWWNRMVTSCDDCKRNCHEFGCWSAWNAWWCYIMEKDRCTVCRCHYTKHVRENKKYETKEKEEIVTFEELKKKYSVKNENVTFDKEAFKKVETEHDEKLRSKDKDTNRVCSLKSLLAENEGKKNGAVKEAYEKIMKLSEIALKPDSAFTIQHLDFLIPRIEELGEAEWIQKLKDMQKAAEKESTKSSVGYLKKVKNFLFSSERP